jgi:hypothetical protein
LASLPQQGVDSGIEFALSIAEKLQILSKLLKHAESVDFGFGFAFEHRNENGTVAAVKSMPLDFGLAGTFDTPADVAKELLSAPPLTHHGDGADWTPCCVGVSKWRPLARIGKAT